MTEAKMRKFLEQMISIMLVVFMGSAIIAVAYSVMMLPRWKVVEALETEGYSEVTLSYAFINRAPIQCGGEDDDLYTYSAMRGQKAVTGFACYRGWAWGVAHWDN